MLFDTNILIQYLNGEEKIVTQLNNWRLEGRACIVSSISVAETLSLDTLSESDTKKVQSFLKTFVSVPFDDQIAFMAATIRRNYGLGLPDAAIAATATMLNVPLITQDKQFKKLKEITVVDI